MSMSISTGARNDKIWCMCLLTYCKQKIKQQSIQFIRCCVDHVDYLLLYNSISDDNNALHSWLMRVFRFI